MNHTLRSRWRILRDMMYPPRCMFCNRVLDFDSELRLCPTCQTVGGIRTISETTDRRCAVCSRPLHKDNERLCATCEALCRTLAGHATFAYDGDVKLAIKQFKYDLIRDDAETMAHLMTSPKELQSVPWRAPYFLAYAPAHPKRERERGFNQARLMAEALSEILNVPIYHGLRRGVETRALKTLGAIDREASMKDAIYADPTVPMPIGTAVIVDDIYTTGSTVAACAQAILSRDPKRPCFFWTFSIRPDVPCKKRDAVLR